MMEVVAFPLLRREDEIETCLDGDDTATADKWLDLALEGFTEECPLDLPGEVAGLVLLSLAELLCLKDCEDALADGVRVDLLLL